MELHQANLIILAEYLLTHNAMWNFQDFCVIQVLREINFVESLPFFFAILGALNFITAFSKCQPSKSSEPLNVFQWQILHF